MTELTPAAPSAIALPEPSPAEFFSVSTTKFLTLWFCSFSFYGLYWFYKNWRLIKEREKSDIMPVWRAIFSIFFCYTLLTRIKKRADSLELKESIAPGPLATGYIALSLLSYLPEPYLLVCFLSVLFLLPAQNLANAVNAKVAPDSPLNSQFTATNIALAVLGGMLFILAVLSTLLPPE